MAFARVAFAFVLFSSMGAAQETSGSLSVNEQADAEMRADPGDPDKAFRAAEAAASAGDVDGTIEALERLLAIDPSLTNIRFELGLLYLRAGRPGPAEDYFEQVVSDPSTPPDFRDRAEALLAESAAMARPIGWTGSVAIGTSYETNANAAPDSVLIAGQPSNIADPDDESQADVSVSVGADLRHVRDFDAGTAKALVTDFSLFGVKYREVDSSDAGFLQVTTGPELRFGQDDGRYVRPYVGASTLFLGGARYRDVGFVGIEAEYAPMERTAVSIDLQARRNSFLDSEANPGASDKTGEEYRASLGVTREISDRLVVNATLFAGRFDAAGDFEANDWLGLSLGGSWAVGNPLAPAFGPAILSASAEYTRIAYAEPDPEVAPDVKQEDDRWGLQATLRAPVRDDLSVDVTVDYVDNVSNVPNDEFNDLRFTAGIRYDFGGIR